MKLRTQLGIFILCTVLLFTLPGNPSIASAAVNSRKSVQDEIAKLEKEIKDLNSLQKSD